MPGKCYFHTYIATACKLSLLLYRIHFDADTDMVAIAQCNFFSNSAQNAGGGLYLATNITSVQLKYSDLSRNKAVSGGALYSERLNHHLVIAGSTFTMNEASSAGACYIGSGHENPAILSGEVFENIYRLRETYQAPAVDTNTSYSYADVDAEAFIVVFESSTSLGAGDELVLLGDQRELLWTTSLQPGLPGVHLPPLRLVGSLVSVELRSKASSSSAETHYGFTMTMYPLYKSHSRPSPTLFKNNTATGSGGGIFVSDSALSAVLIDVLFSWNDALDGGGAYLGSNNGGAVLQNVLFENNRAKNRAGGLFMAANNFGMLIENVKFESNTALIQGGAMYLSSRNGKYLGFLHGNEIALLNCQLFRNTAQDGGSTFLETENVIMVSNTTFSHNSASNDGGGLYLLQYNMFNGSFVNILESFAQYNGGGIFAGLGNAISVVNATFSGNVGGSMGGAMCLLNKTDLLLGGTVGIDGNQAATGGGVALRSSKLWVAAQQGSWLMFRSNTAARGSAVAVADLVASDRSLRNITFDYNVATIGGTFYWLYDSIFRSEPPGLSSASVSWNSNAAPYGVTYATQPMQQTVPRNYTVMVYGAPLSPGIAAFCCTLLNPHLTYF